MLHPSVRDGLEEQYSVIEAARRERATRPASSQNHMSRSQSSSSSKTSRSNTNFHLPSAYTSPLQGSHIAQSPIDSPSRSILKRSKASSLSSNSKTSFLSGVITPEKDQNSYFQDVFLPDMRRTHSQTSNSHRMTRNSSSSSTSTSTSQNTGGTAFVSGSIGRAHTAPRAAASTKSRTPLSSPPVSTVPSRFTRATSVEAGPGVQYSSREGSPFSDPPMSKKSHTSGDTHEAISPRSSLSSRSGTSSLRWSSGSSKTASTSRSVSQPSAISEILEIKNKPSEQAPNLGDVQIGTGEPFNPAAFSWLSLEEDEDESETPPQMERKNSLWRESLDSIASSDLQALEDKEDIRAAHFPTPPPMSRSNSLATTSSSMSRSNSLATTTSIETGRPGSSETFNMEDATRDGVNLQHQSYFDIQASDPASSPLQASITTRKASISELLRVHVVSPLSRNRSGSSDQVKAVKEGSSSTRNSSRSESLTSSSSTVGRPILPPQTILLK